jgi:hypothetical protein
LKIGAKMIKIEIDGREYEMPTDGIIIDRDSGSVSYDEDYMEAYVERSKSHMSKQLTNLRKAYAECFAGPEDRLIDVGCALGLIIQADVTNRWAGTDINPLSEKYIGEMYIPHPADLSKYDVITFQDVFEHLQQPEEILKQIKKGARIVMTIPIWPKKFNFDNLTEWLHYKPDEHYIYCTEEGIIEFMAMNGFKLIDKHMIETSMGRLDAGSFCFKKM